MLKQLLLILCFFISMHSFCQSDPLIDSLLNKRVVPKNLPQKPVKKTDSAIKAPVKESAPPRVVVKDTAIAPINDSATLSAMDSAQNDSLKNVTADTIPLKIIKHLTWQQDTGFSNVFKIPIIHVKADNIFLVEEKRNAQPKDFLFYALVGLVCFLAVIKLGFPKYFMSIFRSFFQASFRQKQSREVLLQNNLPSLLSNILFFLTGGLVIALIMARLNWVNLSFWWLCLYCIALLACIYAGKFLFIRFSGWVFHAGEAANNYIFIVFLVNKIIGILFIPLLLLLAFANAGEANILINICGSVCIFLLIYRYIMIMSFLRNKLKINLLHFFIYFCTVEILPMLVIYKELFNKINIVF